MAHLNAASLVLALGLIPLACSSSPDGNDISDAGSSASMDAGARARTDGSSEGTTRPTAARGDASGVVAPRDASGTTTTGRTPPTVPVFINRLTGGNECLTAWVRDDADRNYIYSRACRNTNDAVWDFVAVPGMAGVYRVRSYDIPDEQQSCVGVSSDNAPQIMGCDQASTQWRLGYDSDGNFQIQSVARAGSCVEVVNGQWAILATCANVHEQYFTARAAP